MCDYSLMGLPSRLASEGEDLVVHRFPTGSLGLASPADLLHSADPLEAKPVGFWARLLEVFGAPRASYTVPAVCIPPGAQLMLQDIPIDLQRSLKVSWVEEVTFTQLTSAANTYRDGVRFKNGSEICLQQLSEGQRVRVFQLSLASETFWKERKGVVF
jgi:hypothetical protein